MRLLREGCLHRHQEVERRGLTENSATTASAMDYDGIPFHYMQLQMICASVHTNKQDMIYRPPTRRYDSKAPR